MAGRKSGKPTRSAPAMREGLTTSFLPQRTFSTSARCRVTHDVPYSLRCVLEASHAWVPVRVDDGGTIGAIQMHDDGKGGRW